MSSTSVVAAGGPTASTPRRPTIDVFNFGVGRWWTCHQHPIGGPPSTSPTLVVAAADLLATLLRGAAIDISNFGDCC
jgi:hypothetical protein